MGSDMARGGNCGSSLAIGMKGSSWLIIDMVGVSSGGVMGRCMKGTGTTTKQMEEAS